MKIKGSDNIFRTPCTYKYIHSMHIHTSYIVCIHTHVHTDKHICKRVVFRFLAYISVFSALLLSITGRDFCAAKSTLRSVNCTYIIANFEAEKIQFLDKTSHANTICWRRNINSKRNFYLFLTRELLGNALLLSRWRGT